MNKKTIITVATIATLIFGSAAPVLAQQQDPRQNAGYSGIFSLFSQLMSRFFERGQQNLSNVVDVQGDQQVVPTGTMPFVVPTGTPQSTTSLLQALVNSGKITSSQEQQIITEVSNIESEIKTWSQTTGISTSFVYFGLRNQFIPAMGMWGEAGKPRPSLTGTLMPPVRITGYQNQGRNYQMYVGHGFITGTPVTPEPTETQ